MFVFSPICFLYLIYLFGLSHFSFSICNHWILLCAMMFHFALIFLCFDLMDFFPSFFIHLQSHLSFLPIQSKVARIFKYTRSTTQSRTYSAFSSVLCTLFQQILIHINNSESFFLFRFTCVIIIYMHIQ